MGAEEYVQADMNRVASTSSARARAREHVLRGCAKRVRNFTERRGVHRRPQIRGRDLLGRVGAANKEDVSEVSTTSSQKASVSAESVVRGMYEAINERNADAALQFVDQNCLYEDLNFPEPKKGIQEVEELFRSSCESIPRGLDFVVDEITEGGGNSKSVGVVWHVEINGLVFPNTRGCSFYRISEESNKLVYARDVVESPFKPGDFAFSLLRVLVPLYMKLQGANSEDNDANANANVNNANANNSVKGDGLPASVFWCIAIGYVSWLILSPPNVLAPGEPIWAIKPDTLKEVMDESINFFYVDILLDYLGISPLPSPVCNPVSEAVFNFVNAWSFMFLPVLLADRKSDGINKWAFWSVQMFLTNAVLTPFLALRASNSNPTSTEAEAEAHDVPVTSARAGEREKEERGDQVVSPLLKQSFGIVGGLVGFTSFGWLLLARPEYGAIGLERMPALAHLVSQDRVSFAFGVDCLLYSLYQSYLLSAVDAQDKSPWKHVPFIGLVRWLLK